MTGNVRTTDKRRRVVFVYLVEGIRGHLIRQPWRREVSRPSHTARTLLTAQENASTIHDQQGGSEASRMRGRRAAWGRRGDAEPRGRIYQHEEVVKVAVLHAPQWLQNVDSARREVMHPFALLQPKSHQIARTEKDTTTPLMAGDGEQHKALASGTRRRRSALSRPL